MDDIMLKIDNVSKMYKLGQIGGTTLRDELQRFAAKLKRKDDPTKRIGSTKHNKNETFMALNGVSFEVKKDERVGIIGHNGAGKSTLLKLISRVTAPTGGSILMNGRVASMLEVGTGFHSELTGRENIYMNGAILGMTKKEIDSKIEDIIDFSECRQFIDTPVKRYSSGMYVKLAFSVAAHLDSEIMIMDEVLAVGDMAFQKKCLDKMNDVSRNDGRTILYVSHNMNTIRQLCDRVIVLDHGKIVYDGDVEPGIVVYSNVKSTDSFIEKDLRCVERYSEGVSERVASFTHIKILNSSSNRFVKQKKAVFEITIESNRVLEHTGIRFVFKGSGNYAVGFSTCMNFSKAKIGENKFVFEVPINQFADGIYNVTLVLLETNDFGSSVELDVAYAFSMEIIGNHDILINPWAWGFIRLNNTEFLLSKNQ